MKVTKDDLIGQRQRRLEKLEKLKKLGINPYPAQAKKDYQNQEIVENFEKFSTKEVSVAGRIMSWRGHGKLIFADILDSSGKLQLLLAKDKLKEGIKDGLLGWENLELLDVGDFVEARGAVIKTSRGEVSVQVKGIRLLAKSLRPIPQKLENREVQLRRRYLDILLHPEKKARFVRKAKFWEASRRFLKEKGFIEVETPVLEHVTGGADARPFITHHNDLNEDLYLRISTELYQKRLMAAGFEKVFTYGPNFRNEGLSEEHLQEYYQIEWYWAYADYRDNMQLVKEMFRYLGEVVWGKTKFSVRNHSFDLNSQWQEIDYKDAIAERFKLDIFTASEEEMLAKLKEANIQLKGTINRNRLVDNLWKCVRKEISGPAFVINEPKFMSPLAKAKASNPRLTERFHVIIGGSELGNGYSEINDPIDQLERFLEQQKLREEGDEEAQMLDIEYVEMLEYGMPPTSGYGQSERIFWFFENISSREGTLFPLLKFDIDPLTSKIYGKDVIRYVKKVAKTKTK